MVNSSKLLTAIVLVHMFSNLLTATYLIAFQVDQANQRNVASQKASVEREELRAQNDNLICLLSVQPDERTQLVIDNCRKATVGN